MTLRVTIGATQRRYTLADVRRFVAAADLAELPDDAPVRARIAIGGRVIELASETPRREQQDGPQ